VGNGPRFEDLIHGGMTVGCPPAVIVVIGFRALGRIESNALGSGPVFVWIGVEDSSLSHHKNFDQLADVDSLWSP
jgi:hypothetical protein